MKNLLVTVSGGRSSARMARHIQTHPKYADYNKVYVFCNTGMERPETITFLKNIVKYWEIPLTIIEGVYSTEKGVGVSYKVVDFDTMDMQAQTFANMIAHYNKGHYNGLPNMGAPYCSDYLKSNPTKKFANDIFGKGKDSYQLAIGYRKEDMPKRISWAEINVETKRIFPLLTDFEVPIGQQELNKFWDSQPFKLGIHNKFGNCELCWKKSTPNLIENIRYGTRFIDWFKEMESAYQSTMFRDRRSIEDLVRLAQEPIQLSFPFETTDGCVCSF